MRNARLLLVCFIAIIAGCNTTRFNRPEVAQCYGLESGNLFCIFKGEEYEVKPTNYICTSPDDYNIIETYVDSIEFRLEQCLKNPKRCQ